MFFLSIPMHPGDLPVIEWFHEFDWLYFELPAMNQGKDKDGNYSFPEHKERLPYTFSLKATIR